MKRKIRKNVFETNSSSTHAVCISKKSDIPKDFQKYVNFETDGFGWEFAIYKDTETKANYLYTAMTQTLDRNDRFDAEDKIEKWLGRNNIQCDFYFGRGNIDGGYELGEFVEFVLSSEENLLKYLFGDSIVVTGNDNEDDFFDYLYELDDSEEGYHCKKDFEKYKIFEKGN